MSRQEFTRVFAPAVLLVMAALSIPASSLDQNRRGVDFLKADKSIGVRVPFSMKVKWYAKRHGAFKGLLLFAFALLGLPAIFGVTGSLNVTNGIYQGGNPRERCIATFKVKTTTNLRSGVFVIIDTTDAEIKAAGAGALNVIGVMSELNWSNAAWDSTTAPTAGDIVTVILAEHGARFKCRNGANLAMGATISTSATGRAAAAIAATDGDFAGKVGRVLESADGSGTEAFILAVS